MRALPLLILLLTTAPAFAGTSPWQELAPGVRARLITADMAAPDRTTLAGIDIDMPQGYKTYWRIPGETGIPTLLDYSGSTGLSAAHVLWPYPSIDESGGVLDYVYFGPTILPATLHVDSDQPNVKLVVTLGICSDICVPVEAQFELPVLLDTPDHEQNARLRQALKRAPRPWAASDGPAPVGDVTLDAGGNALRVVLTGPAVKPASLIASTAGNMPALFGTPQKSPEPGIILLPLLGTTGIKGLEGKPVQLTFLTDAGSFWVSRQILSVPPAAR
jgi:DsbC/DsbD-like thiol-disulfide interchange protein